MMILTDLLAYIIGAGTRIGPDDKATALSPLPLSIPLSVFLFYYLPLSFSLTWPILIKHRKLAGERLQLVDSHL